MMGIEKRAVSSSTAALRPANKVGNASNGKKGKVKRESADIHSGHFMISDVDEHDGSPALEDGDEFFENISKDDITVSSGTGFDFKSASKEPENTYQFPCGERTKSFSIDGTLTKLFQCMTLAYRCIVIS